MTRVEIHPGPRPLALHLAIQAMTWMASRTALPPWNAGLPPWKPDLAARAKNLFADLGGADPEVLAGALDAEAARRLTAFLRGVAAYRDYPRRQPLPPPPVLWSDGTTRLLDYGATHTAARRGRPLLVVPSLINRATVLDLTRERSLLRFLAARGTRPLLVDWGAPGAVERRFTLTDYIAGRLEGALDAAATAGGRPPAVLGYCMGGLMALALAQRRAVAGLVLMATPWDFHADTATRGWTGAVLPAVLAGAEAAGVLSVDVIQALFAGLDPYLTIRKYRRFAEMDPGGEEARLFVALEDWLNDGVPLAAPVARETLQGWYVENSPARDAWRVAGVPVRPEAVGVPALVFLPRRDRIVPPGSAAPLARRLPNAWTRTVASGHIGMVAGGSAPAAVYEPLAQWLEETLG